MIKAKPSPMTPYRRELMLRAIDGLEQNIIIMYNLERLKQCDRILEWLVKNKITGHSLQEFFKHCNNSFLQLAKEVLKKLTKDVSYRPILHGKDWID